MARLTKAISAPIEVNGVKLAAIVIEPGKAAPIHTAQIDRLAAQAGASPPNRFAGCSKRSTKKAWASEPPACSFSSSWPMPSRASARRNTPCTSAMELTALFTGFGPRWPDRAGCSRYFDRITGAAADALRVKAASLHCLMRTATSWCSKASTTFLRSICKKGPVMVQQSLPRSPRMEGHIIYTADMRNDRETIYPEEAAKEGIVSWSVRRHAL